MRRRVLRWTPWVVALLVLVPVVPGAGSSATASGASPSGGVSSPSAVPSGAGAVPSSRLTVAPSYAPPPDVTRLGALPAGTPMDVAVGFAPTDPAGLEALVNAEYAPGSPTFGHYLPASVLAERYGPSPATVADARAYFAGFGLSVTGSPNDLLLLVRGPGARIGEAFGTTFDLYRGPSGRTFVSHPTPATLPTGLSVSGAFGLGNATPVVPAARGTSGPVPVAGPAAACLPGPSGFSPCQVQDAYGFASLVGNGTNGTGEQVGIVDAYSGSEPEPQLSADFSTFAQEFGLPSGGLRFLYPVPTSQNLNLSTVNPGWGLEEALDIEWARAAAPGATIDLTFSPNSGAGLYAAIDALVVSDSVNVLSLSWGEPDTGVYNAFSTPCSLACNASTDGTYALLDPVLEFAAAEGISVFAASGDCGSADGTGGQATNYPASDPFVTGVGGTVLSATTNGAYLSETGWSGNASGSTAPGCVNQGGSGGGFAPFPRPWWQTGLPSLPARRGVPDVSLDAGAPVSIVLGGGSTGVIGTSVATPIWAGIAALADQRAGHPLGFLDPGLYRAAAGPNASVDFHDIVSGNNGYAAGPGWDPVTGIGTPNVGALLKDLAATPTTTVGGPAAFLYASPRFGPVPLTVSFAIAASGGTGTYPLENVYFGDGNASPARGVVTHTFTAPGVYSAVGWVIDSSGNTSASPPIAIVVGGGTNLSVRLTVSNPRPAVGGAVTLAALASGGTAPYRYSFSFGDGTYSSNLTAATVTHAYGAAGGYCAEVVVVDAAVPPDGAASPREAVSVGGAAGPNCGNASTPLTLAPSAPGAVRDAPADFPDLFSATGGATGVPAIPTQFAFASNDSYTAACECAIFRGPGNYSVRGWANDTVDEEATAVTNVSVAPSLDGAFALSHSSGTAPLTVEFFAASRGGDRANANRTVWQFGDGFAAVGHTVNHTYDLPGEYLAVGSLSDAGHGNTSEAFLIDVLAPGGVRGTGIVGTITPAVNVSSGATVRFTASLITPSGGIPLGIEWNLGDGRSAFGPGANQTYFGPFPAPGADTLSGSISAVLPNTVPVATVPFALSPFFAVEAAGFVPRVSAILLTSAVAPTFGLTPFVVTGSSLTSGPGGASTQWFFGDGSNAAGGGVAHTYYAAGDYTVRAVAHDPYSDAAVDSTALVANGPLQIFGGPSPPGGVPPIAVTFSALGVGGTGPPYTYRWTFEGGTVVNGTTATLQYDALGVYWASVNVSDNSGTSVVRNWTVDIHPPVALDGSIILGLAAGVGAAITVVEWGGWLRRRPGRPTLSQRRAAEAVRRVV